MNFSICEKVQGSTEFEPSSPDLVASLWSSPHHGKALQRSGAEHGLGGALPAGLSAGWVPAGGRCWGPRCAPTAVPVPSLLQGLRPYPNLLLACPASKPSGIKTW